MMMMMMMMMMNSVIVLSTKMYRDLQTYTVALITTFLLL